MQLCDGSAEAWVDAERNHVSTQSLGVTTPSDTAQTARICSKLGRRLPDIDLWDDVADLYLVPAMDLEWQEDGTRLFGSDLARRQFMDVAIGELDRRKLKWAWVEGDGDARLKNALAAVEAAGLG